MNRKLGLAMAGLAVVCGAIALAMGGCSGTQGGATPGDNVLPDTPPNTTHGSNDSARHSVTFTLNLANDDDAQASARGLLPRAGVEYPYDDAEMDSISIVKDGVRLGNDCVGDDGSHRTFNVFLVNETGDGMQDTQVEIVSCTGATPDQDTFDYGDLAHGEGGPGPAWDEVDGNEQVWSFSYSGDLHLTATVEVSWLPAPPTPLPKMKIAWLGVRDGMPGIYMADTDGSSAPVMVPGSEGCTSPSLSADGSTLACFDAVRARIKVFHLGDGSQEWKWSSIRVWPSISADGSTIACASHTYERGQQIEWDGLYSSSSLDYHSGYWPLSLSGDGRWLAHWRNYDDTGSSSEELIGIMGGLIIVSTEDGGERNLAPDRESMYGHRSSRISLDAGGTRVAAEGVGILNTDGTGPVVPLPGTCPSISADGEKVAWCASGEVYVGNADGSGTPVNVSDDPAEDGDCSLSADGELVAWTSYRDGNGEIYVARVDGTGDPANISNDPDHDGEWEGSSYSDEGVYKWGPSLQGN